MPDIVIHECTTMFDTVSTFGVHMHSHYKIESIVLCPKSFGFPMTDACILHSLSLVS